MIEGKGAIVYVEDIIKSPQDKRQYKGLQLPNKLQVLLISDPDTDKSAAALNVAVGQLSDPDDLPDLAHFCEHMLFMGTEKYPQENDFDKYLSEHGGHSKAFTSLDNTTYSFDVVPQYFIEALDRFAQFFQCPLMAENCKDREVNTIDSESQMYAFNDTERLFMLKIFVSKDGHPFKKVGVGSRIMLDTLPKEKGIDMRKELLNFYKSWYSSNIMTLIVLGKENLEDLEKIVVSIFSGVENKNIQRPEWQDHPFGPDQVQTKTYIVPLKDIKMLHVCFPTPDLRQYYQSKPSRYVFHLLNHAGPRSLFSVLKERGWCNSLSIYDDATARGFSFIEISCDLTEEGIDRVDDIVCLLFQYLNMLKTTGPQEWIFMEYQAIAKEQFRFRENGNPLDYVLDITENLQNYPVKEAICGPDYYEDWRPDLIEMVLDYLKPSNAVVRIMGRKFESIANEIEPWFGVKFKLEKISTEILNKWAHCGLSKELKLPDPNEFISSDFEILFKGKNNEQPHPLIILENIFLRVWFKQDDIFLVPKADIKLDFTSSFCYIDALNFQLTHIFTKLLEDDLDEYAWDAELAGLSFDIFSTDYGFHLSLSGYNEKQNILLDKILQKIADFKINARRFEMLKEKLVEDLKNMEADQPYEQVQRHFKWLICEKEWSGKELLEAAEKMTVQLLKEFIPQLFSKLHIECIIHGNVDEGRALSLARIIKNRLESTSVFPQKNYFIVK